MASTERTKKVFVLLCLIGISSAGNWIPSGNFMFKDHSRLPKLNDQKVIRVKSFCKYQDPIETKCIDFLYSLKVNARRLADQIPIAMLFPSLNRIYVNLLLLYVPE